MTSSEDYHDMKYLINLAASSMMNNYIFAMLETANVRHKT